MEFEREDTAHYTTSGLNEIGLRYANAILYYCGKSDYYRGPEIASARFTSGDRNIVDVTIVHRGGTDIITDGEITGFQVLEDGVPAEIRSTARLNSNTIRITLEEAANGNVELRYLYGLNPEHSNVAKDNTALQLPLENTISAFSVQNKNTNESK